MSEINEIDMTESRMPSATGSVLNLIGFDDGDVMEVIPNHNHIDVKSNVNCPIPTSPVLCEKCKTEEMMKGLNLEDMTSKDFYWDCYAFYGIHEEMLKDEVRTLAYRNAMLHNKHLFKNKVVLDIGCGTGILSMFAAKTGAKHVIGIECSGIISLAQTIVKDNNLSHKITLIKGKAEEIELPEEYPKVDIIVSEWMAPDCAYTHWKQTIFYIDDYLTVKRGEEITGTFQMTQNPESMREMDLFNITVNYRGELSELQQSFDYKIR